MPHVIVKMWPGRSEQQKKQLTEAIVKDVMDALGAGTEKWISVAIEDVPQKDWAEKVYKPEIANNSKLYRKPGYTLDDL